MDVSTIVTMRYPESEGLPFIKCLEDPYVKELIVPGYIPEFEICGDKENPDYFMKPFNTLTIENRGVFKVAFIFLSSLGKILNPPDMAMVQCPHGLKKGFLLRLIAPAIGWTEKSIEIDYLISINKTFYEINKEISKDLTTSEIHSTETLRFKSIMLSEYPHVVFPPEIENFEECREFFAQYFSKN